MALGTEYEINVDQKIAVFRTTLESGTVLEHRYEHGVMTIPEFGGAGFGVLSIPDLLASNKRYRNWQKIARGQINPNVEARLLVDVSWKVAEDRMQYRCDVDNVLLTRLDWRRNRGLRFHAHPEIRTTWAVCEAWANDLAKFFNMAALAQSEGDGFLAASVELDVRVD